MLGLEKVRKNLEKVLKKSENLQENCGGILVIKFKTIYSKKQPAVNKTPVFGVC